MNEQSNPDARQIQIVAMHRQAAEAIDYLFAVASQHSEEALRANAIHWLAEVGNRAGMRLHELAKDSTRSAEVKHVAERASFWPRPISAWKRNDAIFEAALPAHLVGSARSINMGNSSLETVQVKWAFSFLQVMEIAWWPARHYPTTEKANEYLLIRHGLTLAPEDIELAKSLPEPSPTTLPVWQNALKCHYHRHFPNYGLSTHPEWIEDGWNTGRDGQTPLNKTPKDFQSWIIARINEALRQLVQPKRATRRRGNLVRRKRRN